MKRMCIVLVAVGLLMSACVSEPGAAFSPSPESSIVAATPGSSQAVSGGIPIATAEGSLSRFLPVGAPPLAYCGVDTAPAGPVYQFCSNSGQAKVDAHSGRVVMVSMSLPAHAGSPSVTASDAKGIADSYLTKVGRNVDGMSEDATSVPALSIWSVVYVRYKGAIELPDHVKVDVDAYAGDIVTYMDLYRPYKDPPTPHMTPDAVTQVATTKAGGAKAGLPKLAVMFTADGQQLLVWQVPVGDSACFIDDQTGQFISGASQ